MHESDARAVAVEDLEEAMSCSAVQWYLIYSCCYCYLDWNYAKIYASADHTFMTVF